MKAEEKRKQIENDAAMYKWISHDKYTPGERAALLNGYQVGATTEASKALPLLEALEKVVLEDELGIVATSGKYLAEIAQQAITNYKNSK